MRIGTVTWFNSQKGFGFIQPDDGGQDVVVHFSAVEMAVLRSLNDGQKASYEIVEDNRFGKMSTDQLRTICLKIVATQLGRTTVPHLDCRSRD